jgi:hypothetical protein
LYLETWTLILENEWVYKFKMELNVEKKKNISSQVLA